jgi:hypothetical protein
MPKYEDFKVGDTWVCRDGRESVINTVYPDKQEYPIIGTWQTHTASGMTWADGRLSPNDLMRKIPHVDLTKSLRFKGETGRSFSLSDFENVHEPVTRMVKQFGVVCVDDGEVEAVFDTYKEAEHNCSEDQIVVELTGEYTI